MKMTSLLATAALCTLALQARAETAATPQLTDQQIAGIMKEANTAEIDAAKIARDRATDPQVKDFAKHMIKDHSANNKMAAKIEGKVSVSPVASATSKAMTDDAKTKGAELKKTAKADFDRTYIDQQVAMHTQLLKDLDATYVPQSQNAEIKAFLEETRGHVQKHLEMAQQIQAKIDGSTTTK